MSSTGQGRPTRKEQREQARSERKALEEQQSQHDARRRRLMQLGGVGLIAVVVIAIVVAISASGGGSHAASSESTTGKKAQQEVASLVSGIPQSGNVLGNPNAPVTLVYFGDLECPICRDFTLGALPAIIEKYVRTGKVKIEYRSMETATREPSVFQEQQTAALAAGKQNLMWYFVELFYHLQGEENSGYVTPTYLHERAQQVPGLDLAKWEEAKHDPKLVETLEKDKEAVGENGFSGTPAFLLVKSGHPPKKLERFSTEQLTQASALFEPEIEKFINKG
jgi:protein-disulfide isomerase